MPETATESVDKQQLTIRSVLGLSATHAKWLYAALTAIATILSVISFHGTAAEVVTITLAVLSAAGVRAIPNAKGSPNVRP